MGPDSADLCFLGVSSELICAHVESAFLCEPHLHSTFTIGLMRRGTAQFQIRDRIYSASAGDIFLIHPYEVHFGGDGLEGISYDVIYPTSGFMSDIAKIRKSDREFPYFKDIVVRRSESTEALLNAVAAFGAQDQRPKSVHLIEKALESLFCARSYDAHKIGMVGSQYLAVRTACQIIEESQGASINFQALSERVGLSRFHFIRIFQKATGLTPGAFVRQIRLSRARELIANGGALADVAVDAGFADQAHMTREFRRSYGFTPGRLALGCRQNPAVHEAQAII